MAKLNSAARELIESGALAHLATIDADGSPQVSVVWVGLDGDDIVAAHLDPRQRKLANLRRDPRVTLSFEGTATNDYGLRHHLIVRGTAELTEGGGPELLARLAKTYIGPDAVFPPMPNPPQASSTGSRSRRSPASARGPIEGHCPLDHGCACWPVGLCVFKTHKPPR